MSQLEDEHPDVYHHFLHGLHMVRRSNHLWADLSTDLVIEQVLMRTLKTSGGLTRGRGVTEQQHLTWVMAMPVCAEVNKVSRTSQELGITQESEIKISQLQDKLVIGKTPTLYSGILEIGTPLPLIVICKTFQLVCMHTVCRQCKSCQKSYFGWHERTECGGLHIQEKESSYYNGHQVIGDNRWQYCSNWSTTSF